MPEVETNYVYKDGTPFPTGYCAMPEVYERTFTVKIRSQRLLTEEQVKELLTVRFEADVSLTASTCTVANNK